MISCLIWPSINSWRHHNGLRTQNFNLHIITSSYFWKIDCISVNIDRFSSKFWYVLAATILYRCSINEFSFWWKHHGFFFAIKGGMSIVYILRVFSMGHDFFWKLDSTFPSFTSNISVVLASFSLSIEYVVAETIIYHKCAFISRSDAGIMLIFHLQIGIWEFYFPFTCNRYGKCFGISVTHLTSNLEVTGSSPGVSNNLFFLFDLSPSPLNTKTRRIANRIINSHIYFIITLFLLVPLLFACNS